MTVAKKDLDLLKRVLSCGINPNAKNYDHRTPLHIAASQGLITMAELLLQAGASVLSKDTYGPNIELAFLSDNTFYSISTFIVLM
uniref:Potassium channel GORK n=1 Tax=Cajanus cajan TaxID=3821 RepID=A0A151QXS1_CAJCA|nr:Potassium channel GORK [Cajanus cajan]KYP35136.1 Potassium channel GORK [Cajanus cajan]